jgi:alpha-ribazole phosphatase
VIVHLWRHPKPMGVQGRCIGQLDVPLDHRRAKRLAHRIRAQARREGWPRIVCTSPLRRCWLVGRYLRAWGWRHEVHPALLEMSFGHWEGVSWQEIGRAQVDAWCADFADVAPGGGETLRQMLARVGAWQPPLAHCTVVAHAGWMLARQWVETHAADDVPSTVAQWPQAPSYLQHWVCRAR